MKIAAPAIDFDIAEKRARLPPAIALPSPRHCRGPIAAPAKVAIKIGQNPPHQIAQHRFGLDLDLPVGTA